MTTYDKLTAGATYLCGMTVRNVMRAVWMLGDRKFVVIDGKRIYLPTK
jgi:hypothetical protein